MPHLTARWRSFTSGVDCEKSTPRCSSRALAKINNRRSSCSSISLTASSTSRSIGTAISRYISAEREPRREPTAVREHPTHRWRQAIGVPVGDWVFTMWNWAERVVEPHSTRGAFMTHESRSESAASAAMAIHDGPKLKHIAGSAKDFDYHPALASARLIRKSPTAPANWDDLIPSGVMTTTSGTPSTPADSNSPGSSS